MAFTPKQQNWRWYQNNAAEPTAALAAENTTPTFAYGTYSIIRLRVTIKETGGTADTSEYIKFRYSFDDATWYDAGYNSINYANGAATAGNTITGLLLSDSDTKGEYNESGTNSNSFAANKATEIDIAIGIGNPGELGTIYFMIGRGSTFTEIPLNSGETHPSITITAPQTGINVPKVVAYSVLTSPASAVCVSKVVVYTVLNEDTAIPLTVADGSHSLSSGGIDLIWVLAPSDSAHALASGEVALTQEHILAVSDTALTPLGANVDFRQNHLLAIANASLSLSTGAIAVVQAHLLDMDSVYLPLLGESFWLIYTAPLEVADASMGLASEEPDPLVNALHVDNAVMQFVAPSLGHLVWYGDWKDWKNQKPWAVTWADKWGYLNNPAWMRPGAPVSYTGNEANEPQAWTVVHKNKWGYLNNPRWKDLADD